MDDTLTRMSGCCDDQEKKREFGLRAIARVAENWFVVPVAPSVHGLMKTEKIRAPNQIIDAKKFQSKHETY